MAIKPSFLSTPSTLLGKNIASAQVAARDLFSPQFELKVRGGIGAQPFFVGDEIKKFITEVSFEDNSTQFDHMTIVLESQGDDVGAGRILSMVDSKLFADGNIVEVQMGWGKSLRTVGATQIIRSTPDFSDKTDPLLTVEGYDLMHKMSRRNPRGGDSYIDVRDSQIASRIGDRNGFKILSVDSRSFAGIRRTDGLVTRVQNKGISDYKFLKKVAEVNGFELFSKFDPEQEKFLLFFQPPGLAKQKEVFTFTYNDGTKPYSDTLLSFSPTKDMHDQSTDFELFIVLDKGLSNIKHEFIERLTNKELNKIREETARRFTGGNNSGRQLPLDDPLQIAFKAFGRSFRFPPNKRFKNQDQATAAIKRFIARQKENFISGTGTLKGNEAVQARQIHDLQGLGEQFSGKYFFNQVTHRITKDDGYITEFTCRKVIDDVLVQARPTEVLTDNDRTLKRIKKESLDTGQDFSLGTAQL